MINGSMTPLHLGPVRIDRIVEIEGLGYEPTFFFPESTLDEFHAELGWLAPHFWDTAANTYKRSIQCYLVRTERHTILVDACVGNDEERPSTTVILAAHFASPTAGRIVANGARCKFAVI